MAQAQDMQISAPISTPELWYDGTPFGRCSLGVDQAMAFARQLEIMAEQQAEQQRQQTEQQREMIRLLAMHAQMAEQLAQVHQGQPKPRSKPRASLKERQRRQRKVVAAALAVQAQPHETDSADTHGEWETVQVESPSFPGAEAQVDLSSAKEGAVGEADMELMEKRTVDLMNKALDGTVGKASTESNQAAELQAEVDALKDQLQRSLQEAAADRTRAVEARADAEATKKCLTEALLDKDRLARELGEVGTMLQITQKETLEATGKAGAEMKTSLALQEECEVVKEKLMQALRQASEDANKASEASAKVEAMMESLNRALQAKDTLTRELAEEKAKAQTAQKAIMEAREEANAATTMVAELRREVEALTRAELDGAHAIAPAALRTLDSTKSKRKEKEHISQEQGKGKAGEHFGVFFQTPSLPKPWVVVPDPNIGRFYYWNQVSNKVTWTPPVSSEWRF